MEDRAIPTVVVERLDGSRCHLEVGLSPGHIVLDGDPAPTAAPPHFWPMPIVAKRSPISATAELLFSSTYSNSSNTTVSDIAYENIVLLPPSNLSSCVSLHHSSHMHPFDILLHVKSAFHTELL